MFDYNVDLLLKRVLFITVFLLVNSQPLKCAVLGDLTVIPAAIPTALNKAAHHSSVL